MHYYLAIVLVSISLRLRMLALRDAPTTVSEQITYTLVLLELPQWNIILPRLKKALWSTMPVTQLFATRLFLKQEINIMLWVKNTVECKNSLKGHGVLITIDK